MGVKKTIGLSLILLGALALIIGIMGIFGDQIIQGLNSWAVAIIGLIFFPSGIGLLKSSSPKSSEA